MRRTMVGVSVGTAVLVLTACSGTGEPAAAPVASRAPAAVSSPTTGSPPPASAPASAPAPAPASAVGPPPQAAAPSRDAAAAEEAGPVPASPAAPAPPVPTGPLAADGWAVVDVQIARSTAGGTAISALISNDLGRTRHGRLTLVVRSGGRPVATPTTAVGDVAPGATVRAVFTNGSTNLPGDPAGYTYQLQAAP